MNQLKAINCKAVAWAMDNCIICGDNLHNGEKTVVLGGKGANGINTIASLQPSSVINVSAGQVVHVICRRNFCPRSSKSYSNSVETTDETPSRGRCSQVPKFVFEEHCFLCGKPAKFDGKKRGYDVIPVRTIDFKNTFQEVCRIRNDDWAKEVWGRLEVVNDLHAADAVYHNQCSVNFRTKKQIPKQFDDLLEPRQKVQRMGAGHPVSECKNDAFMKVVEYLQDNSENQVTLTDLCDKMAEYLSESNEKPYSVKYMKSKLLDHFGDNIVITTIMNVANVVTFRRTAASIINEFYCQPKNEDEEKEKVRMVETVAKLIMNEIRSLEVKGKDYPSVDEMSSSDEAMKFVPDLLRLLLSLMIKGKDVELKIASLGQAITQAVRPKAILAPLQLGLAVQMHHHFASKFLIDSLNSLGFCSSYSTVQNYERAAAVTCGTDIPGWVPGMFMQHAADNVDHNVRTLDGTGTFHGMGIVAAVTPSCKSSQKIPYRSKLVTKEELCAVGGIDIVYYQGESECKTLKYKERRSLNVVNHASNLDLLFKLSLPLLWSPRPSWSGTMQLVCTGVHPGKSAVFFLPMIDMDPGDLTCLYSTLWFITRQAKRYRVTPICTFDQPLWWKALTIVQNEPLNSELKSLVVRLGGLHIEMSFLGCIGHIMAGSGMCQ